MAQIQPQYNQRLSSSGNNNGGSDLQRNNFLQNNKNYFVNDDVEDQSDDQNKIDQQQLLPKQQELQQTKQQQNQQELGEQEDQYEYEEEYDKKEDNKAYGIENTQNRNLNYQNNKNIIGNINDNDNQIVEYNDKKSHIENVPYQASQNGFKQFNGFNNSQSQNTGQYVQEIQYQNNNNNHQKQQQRQIQQHDELEEILSQISEELKQDRTTNALDICQMTFNTAHQQNDPSGFVIIANRILKLLNTEAVQSLNANQFDKTLFILSKAKQISESQLLPAPSPFLALTFNNFGCYYKRFQQLPKALGYLEQALRFMKSFQYRQYLGMTFLNISAVLSQMGEHYSALENAKKALLETHKDYQEVMRRRNENQNNDEEFIDACQALSIAFYNLGVEQDHFENFEEAIFNYNKACEVAEDNLGGQHRLTKKFKELFQKFHEKIANHQYQQGNETQQYQLDNLLSNSSNRNINAVTSNRLNNSRNLLKRPQSGKINQNRSINNNNNNNTSLTSHESRDSIQARVLPVRPAYGVKLNDIGQNGKPTQFKRGLQLNRIPTESARSVTDLNAKQNKLPIPSKSPPKINIPYSSKKNLKKQTIQLQMPSIGSYYQSGSVSAKNGYMRPSSAQINSAMGKKNGQEVGKIVQENQNQGNARPISTQGGLGSKTTAIDTKSAARQQQQQIGGNKTENNINLKRKQEGKSINKYDWDESDSQNGDERTNKTETNKQLVAKQQEFLKNIQDEAQAIIQRLKQEEKEIKERIEIMMNHTVTQEKEIKVKDKLNKEKEELNEIMQKQKQEQEQLQRILQRKEEEIKKEKDRQILLAEEKKRNKEEQRVKESEKQNELEKQNNEEKQRLLKIKALNEEEQNRLKEIQEKAQEEQRKVEEEKLALKKQLDDAERLKREIEIQKRENEEHKKILAEENQKLKDEKQKLEEQINNLMKLGQQKKEQEQEKLDEKERIIAREKEKQIENDRIAREEQERKEQLRIQLEKEQEDQRQEELKKKKALEKKELEEQKYVLKKNYDSQYDIGVQRLNEYVITVHGIPLNNNLKHLQVNVDLSALAAKADFGINEQIIQKVCQHLIQKSTITNEEQQYQISIDTNWKCDYGTDDECILEKKGNENGQHEYQVILHSKLDVIGDEELTFFKSELQQPGDNQKPPYALDINNAEKQVIAKKEDIQKSQALSNSVCETPTPTGRNYFDFTKKVDHINNQNQDDIAGNDDELAESIDQEEVKAAIIIQHQVKQKKQINAKKKEKVILLQSFVERYNMKFIFQLFMKVKKSKAQDFISFENILKKPNHWHAKLLVSSFLSSELLQRSKEHGFSPLNYVNHNGK